MLTTSQAYFASVLDYLNKRGISSASALTAIGFDEYLDYKKHLRVTFEHYSAVLEYGKNTLNDPLFGFHLGCEIHSADYGVLGYLIESSENLAIAIRQLLIFDKLVANIGAIDFSIQNNQALIRWTPKAHCSEQVVLRNMAAWLTTAQQLLGPHYRPNIVTLSHHYHSDALALLQQALDCTVLVAQPDNTIAFPSELLNITFRSGNPQLHQTMEAMSQHELQALDNQHSIKHQIIHLLSVKPDLQDCTLIQFAGVFNMSPRTLQRYLKQEHCRFATLLDSERKQRALNQIDTLSCGELSAQLGFSEQSSFNRAFKRWTGHAPRDYLYQMH